MNQSPAERILALYKTAVLHDYRCKKNDCYQVDDTEQEHHGITLLQAKTQFRDALLERLPWYFMKQQVCYNCEHANMGLLCPHENELPCSICGHHPQPAPKPDPCGCTPVIPMKKVKKEIYEFFGESE